MKVNLKELNRDAFEVEINENRTIKDLKNAIKEIVGYAVFRQTLILKGRVLLEKEGIQSYQITSENTIILFYSSKRAAVSRKEQLLVDIGYSADQVKDAMLETDGNYGGALELLLMTGIPYRPKVKPDFLLGNPQFMQIAEIIKRNPNELEKFLNLLEQDNPGLYRIVNRNHEWLLNVLGASNQVTLDDEEEQEVKELMNLGFSAQAAVEAYLLCNRNKQYAANYLLTRS